MAKVTYDLTDVDDMGDDAQAPVGTYIGKIEECEAKDSSKGNPMLEVRWTLTHDATGAKLKENYAPIWDYPILQHESKFVMSKTKAFFVAVGAKLKGELDPNKLVGKKALLKLKSDTDDSGDYRPRIGKILPVGEAGAGSQDEPEPVDEPEAENGEDAVDLDAMDRDELKKFIRSEGLGTLKDLGITAKTSDDEIRDLIAAKMGGGEDEPEPEEDEPEPEPEEEPEPEDAVDLDSMDRDALKKFIKEEQLGTLADLGINKSTSDDQIREIIQNAMGSEPEPEEEPEPEDEPEAEPDADDEPEGDNYESMTPKALADEIAERSLDVPADVKKLKGAKLKAALVDILRTDDAESPF